ncbi:MAG: hypothetical protein FJ145_02155 [Deltaproteobacteria bacterium]|nr:hypothetical protein [Deltaproteobacteria bacterium]
MIEHWAAALEATPLAAALRNSVWSYPLVNAGHILGVAVLVGSIVPLDLRLLGVWPSVPLVPLYRVLARTGATGLAIAVTCGFLLFIARASEYVASELFLSKMVVVAIGAANVLTIGRLPGFQQPQTDAPHANLPLRSRLAAFVSLVSWLTALILGRLVGYF